MVWLIIGLVVFHGIHSLRMIAPAWRNAKYEQMGEGAWKSAYSVVSLIALVLMIWGYSQARSDAAILYNPPIWSRHVAMLLMLLAFIALMVFNLPGGKLKAKLKHPMLVSIKLWAFAHLLANGDLASVLLFGSFLIWAVWNRISVKRRGDAVPAMGPVKFDIMAVVSGILIWALFIWVAHEWLFGVPILT